MSVTVLMVTEGDYRDEVNPTEFVAEQLFGELRSFVYDGGRPLWLQAQAREIARRIAASIDWFEPCDSYLDLISRAIYTEFDEGDYPADLMAGFTGRWSLEVVTHAIAVRIWRLWRQHWLPVGPAGR